MDEGQIPNQERTFVGASGPGVGKAPLEHHPVTDHMTDLEAQMDTLEREIHILIEKIVPVVAQVTSEASPPSLAPPARDQEMVGSSDLASRIRGVANNTMRLQGLISSTYSRIEL